MSERSKKRKAKLKRKQAWAREKAANLTPWAACGCHNCKIIERNVASSEAEAARMLAEEAGPDVETVYVTMWIRGLSFGSVLWRGAADYLAGVTDILGGTVAVADGGEMVLSFPEGTPDFHLSLATTAHGAMVKAWAASPLRKDGRPPRFDFAQRTDFVTDEVKPT